MIDSVKARTRRECRVDRLAECGYVTMVVYDAFGHLLDGDFTHSHDIFSCTDFDRTEGQGFGLALGHCDEIGRIDHV